MTQELHVPKGLGTGFSGRLQHRWSRPIEPLMPRVSIPDTANNSPYSCWLCVLPPAPPPPCVHSRRGVWSGGVLKSCNQQRKGTTIATAFRTSARAAYPTRALVTRMR